MHSCKDDNGNSFFSPKRIDPPSIEDRASIDDREDMDRSMWQKPAVILGMLGDVQGKTIADIGSGTGYFTFHLAYLDAKIIAIDIDQEMLAHIDMFKKKLPDELIPNIETRLAKEDDPLLQKEEVDHAIIINTIGYIDEMTNYLRTLKRGIIRDGSVVIVDYKLATGKIHAPSPEVLVTAEEVASALGQAGYTSIDIDANSLKYQYIITACVSEDCSL